MAHKKTDLRSKQSKRKIVKQNRSLWYLNIVYKAIISAQQAQMEAMKHAAILTRKFEEGGIVILGDKDRGGETVTIPSIGL